MLASPVLRWKNLKNIGLKGRQIINLLGAPTYLGPALRIGHPSKMNSVWESKTISLWAIDRDSPLSASFIATLAVWQKSVVVTFFLWEPLLRCWTPYHKISPLSRIPHRFQSILHRSVQSSVRTCNDHLYICLSPETAEQVSTERVIRSVHRKL